jgi:erythromycin esterase
LVAVAEDLKGCSFPIHTIEPGPPYDDLAPLNEIVGDARVVLLGDSRHDATEQHRLKHRIIRYLVEEMGFNVIALEESLATSLPMDSWARGSEGNPEELLAGLGAWFIWDTTDMLEMLRWLRAHNLRRRAAERVRLVGIDLSDGAHRGVRASLSFLDRVDPAAAELVRSERLGLDLLSNRLWTDSVDRYTRTTEPERAAVERGLSHLVRALQEQRPLCSSRSSVEEADLAIRQAELALDAHRMFSCLVTDDGGGDGGDGDDDDATEDQAARSYACGGAVRERAMADTVQWLLSRADTQTAQTTQTTQTRIVVWAHNAHAAKAEIDIDIPGRPPIDGVMPMGGLLAARLGSELVSIGFTFERSRQPGRLPGPPSGSVDSMLAETYRPYSLVDLRSIPAASEAASWLARPRPIRAEDGVITAAPAEAFDALVFVETLTPVTRGPRSQARLRELGGG